MTVRIDKTKHYYHNCFQDSSHVQKPDKTEKRDPTLMTKFFLESGLAIKPDFNNCELSIGLRHKSHPSYMNVQLSPAALQFIISQYLHQTPAQIYRDLQTYGILDVEKAA